MGSLPVTSGAAHFIGHQAQGGYLRACLKNDLQPFSYL
jgi:hypothetical protein